MSLAKLRPEPPLWATNAGLPEPRDDEGFAGYCKRIGVDSEQFLVGLHEQTYSLANIRLATYLARVMKKAYDAHINAYCAARLDPERRRELHLFARDIPLTPTERRHEEGSHASP